MILEPKTDPPGQGNMALNMIGYYIAESVIQFAR